MSEQHIEQLVLLYIRNNLKYDSQADGLKHSKIQKGYNPIRNRSKHNFKYTFFIASVCGTIF
jgi:hypothetical protein